ncbi:hypothetical protein ACIQXA_16990 [Streptomyces massasporeus]|uniref:hypothetical protein n=1 Tax=Streptomyces massasporeus TaxID=67324 RepID=UPI00381DEB15
MGDHFQTIVDLDASAADAERLAGRVVDWLVTEGIVLAERTDCVLGRSLGHPPAPRPCPTGPGRTTASPSATSASSSGTGPS